MARTVPPSVRRSEYVNGLEWQWLESPNTLEASGSFSLRTVLPVSEQMSENLGGPCLQTRDDVGTAEKKGQYVCMLV